MEREAIQPPHDVASHAGPAHVPATEIAPELAQIFASEAQDHLSAIAEATARVCEGRDVASNLRDLRRSVHTLKGAAGMVGFRTLSQLAHRLEDLLDAWHERHVTPGKEAHDLLRRSVDLLADLVAGTGGPDVGERLAEVESACRSGLGPLPAEAAPRAADGVPAPAAGDASPDPAIARHEGVGTDRGPADGHEVAPAERNRLLRVPIARLDEAVREVGELIVTNSMLEQHLDRLQSQVDEMERAVDRVRRLASRLESEYEVLTLGGNLERRFGARASSTPVAPAPRDATVFDELELDRYTDFHLISRELTETSSDIATIGHQLRDLSAEFGGSLQRLGRSTAGLQHGLQGLRLVPLSSLSSRLERTVRVTAERQGKGVDLLLDGFEQPVDVGLADALSEPLMHLLRNAVDHGIEAASLRAARGKAETGHVVVSARRRGNQLVLEVADDGGGFDYAKLRARAVTSGLLTEQEAAAAGEARLRSLVFLPGFSTAAEVSEISGRGVGLDVVRARILALKGQIVVDSAPGEGATFTLSVPLALAIIRGVVVTAGGQICAMPLASVDAVYRVRRDAIVDDVVHLPEQEVPAVWLADAFGRGPAAGVPAGDSVAALLVEITGRRTALLVDAILDTRDLVVKSLAPQLRRVPGVAGATVLGDGQVVLILEPAVAARRAMADPVPQAAALETGAPVALDVMIVDDSLSVRRVLSTLVGRAGWNPIEARDGMDALEQCWRRPAPPDVILLDIEMPRLDGFELTAALRAQAQFQDVPIVMITSRGGDKHRHRAMSLGATEYLVKPFDEEVLLATIRRLARSGASRAA